MSDFILSYVEHTYSPELQSEIRRSLSLFDLFEFNQALEDMDDVFSMESYMTSEDMQDLFITKINEKLDYLLKAHKVALVPEVRLRDKNEILTGLGRLQHRDDYTPIIGLLESFSPKEDVFCRIIEEVTELDQTYVLSILEDVEQETLDLLKDFIYQKEDTEEPIDVQDTNEVSELMKSFIYLFKDESVGVQLFKAGSAIGVKFELYLSYVGQDIIDQDDEKTALNILSLLFMSSDGRTNPLETYREYSLTLLNSSTKAATIEAILLNKISKFNSYHAIVKESSKDAEQ